MSKRGEYGGKILVVDDDRDLRQAIQWVLEDEGFEVETAADGQQALDRALANRPSLIVLDMGLPVLSGEAVGAAVFAAYGATVPIVVVTADGRSAEKARSVGAFDYLHKPFHLDDLVSKVRSGIASV